MSRLPLALCLVVVTGLGGCAHLRGEGDIDTLKPAVEAFHQALRWKDFRTAADAVVPERRSAFIKARLVDNDERDLFITDFQLEDAQVEADKKSAAVISRLSWYRLPDATERSAVITSRLVWRANAWLVESQDDGPFSKELPPTP